MAVNLLFTVPTSALASSLCPFLSSYDLIAFRTSCKNAYELIHNGQESESIWRNALSRDFLISNEDSLLTLRIAKTSLGGGLNGPPRSTEEGLSIFGYSPIDSVFVATSVFNSWKHWRKASLIFYENHILTTSTTSEVAATQNTPNRRCIHGPYFIRAASFWSKILQWCNDPTKSGNVGIHIRSTLSRGLRYIDWPVILRSNVNKNSLWASFAIYAFCGGQNSDLQSLKYGLLGGYNAYNYYSITSLRPPGHAGLSSDNYAILAMCRLSPQSNTMKAFGVSLENGQVYCISSHGRAPAVNNNDGPANNEKMYDNVLVWLEEYARRLDTGVYRVSSMDQLGAYLDADDDEAIVLYPRLPRGATPPQQQTVGKQIVSRAVTRGVEVIASAVFTPQCAISGMGFIYSIRIRLLTPEDGGDEYVSESERGFGTCQLQSRHWKITNDDAAGQIDRVNGDGVIGMYPLLREGGYRESDEDFDGTMVYQSCTGPMNGSFEGHMRFVPGSLDTPTGDAFDVELKPFVLETKPDFLY